MTAEDGLPKFKTGRCPKGTAWAKPSLLSVGHGACVEPSHCLLPWHTHLCHRLGALAVLYEWLLPIFCHVCSATFVMRLNKNTATLSHWFLVLIPGQPGTTFECPATSEHQLVTA